MEAPHRRPSQAELLAAAAKTVRDVIAPGLKMLLVGINPGLYTAAIGHHFGRPGNRFWPAIYLAGFTPRLYSPYEDMELLKLGYGITNFVMRASAKADELTVEELRAGGRVLEEKVRAYAPRCVGVLGVGAYRAAYDRPKAAVGLQAERLGGAPVWVLPNPSGLNAHYTLESMAAVFRQAREWADDLGS